MTVGYNILVIDGRTEWNAFVNGVGRKPGACLVCGNPAKIGLRGPLGKFCSNKCRWKDGHARAKARKPTEYNLTCKGCGRDFVDDHRHAYCSKKCYPSEVRITSRRRGVKTYNQAVYNKQRRQLDPEYAQSERERMVKRCKEKCAREGRVYVPIKDRAEAAETLHQIILMREAERMIEMLDPEKMKTRAELKNEKRRLAYEKHLAKMKWRYHNDPKYRARMLHLSKEWQRKKKESKNDQSNGAKASRSRPIDHEQRRVVASDTRTTAPVNRSNRRTRPARA